MQPLDPETYSRCHNVCLALTSSIMCHKVRELNKNTTKRTDLMVKSQTKSKASCGFEH